MDSVVHYVTTIPAIRNLICMTHHDYLPHEFEPVLVEPDLYFQMIDLKYSNGQVESIKFKLFCYDHEVQYLQAFVGDWFYKHVLTRRVLGQSMDL